MKNNTKSLQETKKHTDFMFPYNVYPCTIPLDFPIVYLHWQNTMEIIYIKKGRGIVQVDLSVFEVSKGDILFITPGILHGIKHLNKEPMEYENIIFDLSFLGLGTADICSQKYLQPLQDHSLLFPFLLTPSDPEYKKISSCLDIADHLCATRCDGYELGVKGSIMTMISLLFQTGKIERLNTAQTNYTEKLKSVISYIENNYTSPISIEEISTLCGYSSSHFMRWFKEVTGLSFVRYLNGYRLEKAVELLKNTDDTILEVAFQSGFDNISYFNRIFKKHFHITPKEMRHLQTK